MDNEKNKILIVDDIEDVRESLAQLLEDEEYNIFQASNGVEAMKIISKLQIDIMITDILMPKMNGVELSIEARKIFPGLKIILITGGGRQIEKASVENYLIKATKKTGVEHILKKPFSPETFINIVNQLLNKQPGGSKIRDYL